MSDSTEQLDRQSPHEGKRTKWGSGQGTLITLMVIGALLSFIAGAALLGGIDVSPESESDPSGCAEVVGKTATLRDDELTIADDEDVNPISWFVDGLTPHEHECASSRVRVSAWNLDSTSITTYAYGINSLTKSGGRCAWIDDDGIDQSAPCVGTTLSPRSEVHQMLVKNTKAQLPHPDKWDGNLTGDLTFIVIDGLDCQKCDPRRTTPEG